ncbi:unnamed protein product [Phytophthora fragariaefolia]|uniref:Unnamed protein product n=1 Tax=Phytophthora fragariaefolia TaxID=1490495 RepID=A0A9W6Y3A8_9STRA|nr:unnamed protein product [Phytophthora fragariaefolia]
MSRHLDRGAGDSITGITDTGQTLTQRRVPSFAGAARDEAENRKHGGASCNDLCAWMSTAAKLYCRVYSVGRYMYDHADARSACFS